MSSTQASPVFKVGDIVRPKAMAKNGGPVVYADMSKPPGERSYPVVGEPTCRVTIDAQYHRHIYVEHVAQPGTQWLFFAEDLVKVPAEPQFEVGDIAIPRTGAAYLDVLTGQRLTVVGTGMQGRITSIVQSTNSAYVSPIGSTASYLFSLDDLVFDYKPKNQRLPVFQAGSHVRALVTAYSVTGQFFVGLGSVWEVQGYSVLDPTEPVVLLDVPGSYCLRAFHVSQFEQVMRDVVRAEWVPCRTTEQEQQILRRTLRRHAKTLSYQQPPTFNVEALRERAAATGATLPLSLESTEPVNDWSTGFDEHYDDHAPRNRKL